LYASDDSGETWTLLREDKLGFYNLTVLPDGKLIEGRPGGGPSGGGAGVRCSADGGRTWQEHCGQVQPR
jgi:hypothetical protein